MDISGLEIRADASSTMFAIERSQYREDGTLALPVYGAPLPNNQNYPNGGSLNNPATPTRCRIVRLSAPIEYHTIIFTAVKEGAAPIIPNPYGMNSNLVFRKGRRSGMIPVDLPGYEGHAWSMTGEYHFWVLSPTDLNSSMPLGIVPWENAGLTVDNSLIPNTNIVSWLLEKKPVNLQDPVFIPPSP